MGSLRVALVHPFSWPEVRRGGERLLHDLAWYLQSAGHHVEVVTAATGEPVTEEVDGVVFRRLRLPRPAVLERRGLGPIDTFGAPALLALARRRYDVVHSLTPTGAIAGRLSGHRPVYTVLGHPAAEDFALRRGSLALFRAGVRAAAATVALSRSAASRVEQHTGHAPEVIPPGVRLDRFTPDLAARRGPVRVLFASDASEIRKGVHVAMAAVVRLRRRGVDARLVLAGPGDPRWALTGVGAGASPVLARVDPLAVAGLGADGEAALEATEQVEADSSAMPELYRSATVTVLPSWQEAFGLVLAESLACGTPVACADDGGMLEVVDTPEVGRTAPFGDPDALADAIAGAAELAADPATPARCAAHARRWGWAESVGPAYVDLYRRVVRR
ncbi:MAG TPA: glycosyltransferase family 4 protein [Acidimicrobiales bacterium]|nr:glycosyltransferase family 4 protein [Acidimicrobiales bacterium]